MMKEDKVKREFHDTEAFKNGNFGRALFKLRKERKFTQQQLAELIGVSNKTISKWEKGESVPDLYNISNICNVLDISPSALVKSQTTFKDRITVFKRKLFTGFNYLLKNIFTITFYCLFIYFLVYFVNNYNTIKIYNIKYDSENISINRSYLIKTKVVNILTIDNIKLSKIDYVPTTYEIELYTFFNGDKYIIYEGANLDDIRIEEIKNSEDILSKDVIDSMKHSLYLHIITTDKQENTHDYEATLSINEIYSNNKLMYDDNHHSDKYDTSYLSFLNSNNSGYTKIFNIKGNYTQNNELIDTQSVDNKLSVLGFDYDEDNHMYSKIDDYGGKVEYDEVSRIVKYEYLYNNEINYKMIYHIENNKIDIIEEDLINKKNHQRIQISLFNKDYCKDANIDECHLSKRIIELKNEIYAILYS